jgi:hypothetical protein
MLSHDERMLFRHQGNIPKPYFRSFDVTSLANHREGANNIACNRTQVFAFLMKRVVTAKAMMSLEVTLNA